MNNCKICNSIDISELMGTISFEYKGYVVTVPEEYSICNVCEREFISKNQILNNDSFIRSFTKSCIDGDTPVEEWVIRRNHTASFKSVRESSGDTITFEEG